MSCESGWEAINLRFVERVPRTECSAHRHWERVKAVTGIDTSREENREIASKEFVRMWDYAFMWMCPTGPDIKKYGKTTSLTIKSYGNLFWRQVKS